MRPASNTATGYLVDWKIWSSGIYVDGSIYSTGSIVSNSGMSMVDECTGAEPGLIATRAWVSQRVNDDVAPAIKVTNNAAAAAMKAAKAAKVAADTAMTEIKNNSITSIAFTKPGIDNNGFEGLQVTVTKGDGSKVTTGGVSFAGSHSHKDEITIEDGVIKLIHGNVSSPNQNFESATIFNDKGGLSFSANDDGIINFSITIAGKTGKATFNMADTKFYKAHTVSAVKMEAYTSGGAAVRAYAYDVNGNKITGIFGTGTLTLRNQTTSEPEVYLAGSDPEAKVSVKAAYDQGWKDAAKKFSRSRNVITGPSETVGGTKSYTAKASLSGSFSYSAKMYIPGGTTFTDSAGNYHSINTSGTWWKNVNDSHEATISWSE